MTSKSEFTLALDAAGIPTWQTPRVEIDGRYKYECFDDASGREIAFISWCNGKADYVICQPPTH